MVIVNIRGIIGYGRFLSDFIPLGSELFTGCITSLLLLSLLGKLLSSNTAKSRSLTLPDVDFSISKRM